jgi:hypothetical protein
MKREEDGILKRRIVERIGEKWKKEKNSLGHEMIENNNGGRKYKT